MAEYECSCGFSANRAAKLHAHLTQNRGQGHNIVAYGAYSMPTSTEASPDLADAQPEEETVADLLARMPPTPSNPISPTTAKDNNKGAPRTASTAQARDLLDSSSEESSSDLEGTWEAVRAEDMTDVYGEAEGAGGLDSPPLQQESTPSPESRSPPTPVGELNTRQGINPRMSLAAGALNRVSDLLWRRPSLAGTPAMSPSHGCGSGQQALLVNPDFIEKILLWEDPWLTTRVLCLGTYLLICCRQLAHGEHAVQPTTALALAALGVLAYNAAHRAWQEQQRRAGKLQAAQPPKAEAAVQQRASSLLMQAAGMAAPVLAASFMVVRRRLSGAHDSPATCVWVGLALWGMACLGELRLMGQATYACALWVSLFTLPLTYTICRTALDALVAEGLALAAQLLGPRHRGITGTAGLAGLVVASMVSSSWVVRASAGALTCTGIIVWRCCAQPAGLSSRPQRPWQD